MEALCNYPFSLYPTPLFIHVHYLLLACADLFFLLTQLFLFLLFCFFFLFPFTFASWFS